MPVSKMLSPQALIDQRRRAGIDGPPFALFNRLSTVNRHTKHVEHASQ